MTTPGRLPRTVIPRRYDLTVAPDLVTGEFTGEVTIALEIAEATNRIVLHAQDLDVEIARLDQGNRTPAATARLVPDLEQLVVDVPDGLAPGPASLALRFRGQLSDGLVGFYRSTFTDADGNPRTLAATQFEAPHARRAFPCFDEPAFKAVFRIALEVDEELLAISNGPEIARDALPDGRVRIRFGDTIAMSTYLVAYVVGPLETTAPVDVGDVPLRVVHAPGRAHLTAFATEVGAFALRFFEDYYGIPYPAEKLDFVALPDFAFGAMENLGCVTFRESVLLVDADTITHQEAAQVALTIVHEVAHMWFGDLVTMTWWNGIWLNEAFARFMEQAGVDAFRPEWRTWDDFAINRASALDVDALAATRPVEYEVLTPEDADGMFDTLTYDKGGSLVRMLEQWLGAERFQAGVRLYLDRYQFGNTETTDLWDALEEAVGEPVRRIMDSWIFQPGFPELLATRSGETVTLSQRRFSYETREGVGRWSVPALVRVHDGADAETRALLVDDDDTSFRVPPDALVVIDAGGHGFFRVGYPPGWREQLVDAGVLTAMERFSVIDDAWASVLSGTTSMPELLALARRFGSETDLVVWRLLVARLRDASRLVDGAALDALREHVAGLVSPTFTELGWDASPEETARTRQLRGILIDAMGTIAEDRTTVARARETFARALRDSHAVDPDVTAAVISIVAHTGTADDFEVFLTQFRSAATPQEQLRYLYALGAFPDEDEVLRAARFAISDEVRPQNGPFVLQRGLRNRRRGPLVWAFARDHWDLVRGRFPATLIGRMVEGVSWLVDDDSVLDVPRFLAEHPVPEGQRIIAQHLERQRVHRALLERERERFTRVLHAE